MNEVVGDDGDPSCPSRAVSGFISNEIIIYLLDKSNCYFIFIIINYCKLPSPALFGTKFCFVLWPNFLWYESQSQKDIWRISLGVKGECMWAVNNGMAFIRSLRTFHNNMLSVISYQTKKIEMKANFYFFLLLMSIAEYYLLHTAMIAKILSLLLLMTVLFFLIATGQFPWWW